MTSGNAAEGYNIPQANRCIILGQSSNPYIDFQAWRLILHRYKLRKCYLQIIGQANLYNAAFRALPVFPCLKNCFAKTLHSEKLSVRASLVRQPSRSSKLRGKRNSRST